MADLTDIKVVIPNDIQGWINEGKANDNANIVFKVGYTKFLVNRAIECLANEIETSDQARQVLCNDIHEKVNRLPPNKANKFCIKIAKLMKEELTSQLKEDIKSLVERKQVKTLEEFMKE